VKSMLRSHANARASTPRWLPLACLLVWAGCSSALLSKSEPLHVQYYAPPERAGRFAVPPRAPNAQPPLRLGRVSGAAHLDLRMVSREPGNQLVYQDTLRWTEAPAHYLDRALRHALFEEHAITQAVAGRALTLEAQLVAFEQVSDGPGSARVSVTFTLHDERTSRVLETLTLERDLAGRKTEDLVAALSTALDECVDRIATRIAAELGSSSP
jgi:uncharacterized lipoprotein YmbA